MELRLQLRIRAFFALATAFLTITAAFGVLTAQPARAAQTVPYKINFQGRLTDNSGNVLADGSYNVKFRMFDAATSGTNKWEGDRVYGASDNRITITNGLFNIQFGDTTKGDPALSPTLFSGTFPLYLEVELPTPATATCASNGCATFTEGAMTPRQPLASSPYAFNSDTLDGLDSTAFGQLSVAQAWTDTNTFSKSGGAGLALTGTAASAGTLLQFGSVAALTSGSANGTYIGANPASYTGDFVNFQIGGVVKFKVDNSGNATVAGSLNVGGVAAISASGLVQNAAIDPSTTYSNIAKVGTLTAGALGSGFTAVNVAQGGTGTNTLAANGILQGNGTSAVSAITPGLSGTVLVSNGTTASFTTISNSSLAAGTYTSITGTGALAAGSIATGFGAIVTTNAITGGAVTGTSLSTSGGGNITAGAGSVTGGSFKIGANDINTGGGSPTLSNVDYLDAAQSLSATKSFTKSGGAGAVFSGSAVSGGAQLQFGSVAALTSGSTNGTYIGANPASYTGDFVNFQIAGAVKLKVDTSGNTTVAGSLNVGGVAAISASGLIQNAAIDPTVTYSNIAKVGTLTVGALGTGFTAVNVAQGGTGANTLVQNGILQGNGTGAITAIAPGLSGTVLVSNGTTTSFSTLSNASLSAGTYANITGTGALAAGSIASGFGSIATTSTISTSNNISTTGSGTVTSAGLLTASGGATITGNTTASGQFNASSTTGTSSQGYFIQNTALSKPVASYQALDLGASGAFSFLANNKNYTGSSWADDGQSELGSSFQIQNDNFNFYSFDTGVNFISRLAVASGGNVGVGEATPTGLFQVGQPTAGPGTVTLNATAAVVGSTATATTTNGTQFLNTFKVGDSITASGQTRTIQTITDNTHLTVTAAFTVSGSALAYTLTGGDRFTVLGNGNVGIGTNTPASLLSVGASGQLQVDNSGNLTTIGNATFTGGHISVTATSAPATDQVAISNVGQPVTTSGVNGLNITYVGGAITSSGEASGARIDITPGSTSPSTWNGLRIVSTAGAGAGVNFNGIKIDGPASAGGGTEVGLNVTTGWDVGVNIQSGGVQMTDMSSDPSTPAAGSLKVYSRTVAGRSMLSVRGSTGINYALQPSLAQQNVFLATPGSGTTSTLLSTTGGYYTLGSSAPAVPTASELTGSLASFGTTTTLGTVTGFAGGTSQFYRGSVVNGANGFFYFARITLNDSTLANYTTSASGVRMFFGLTDQTTAVMGASNSPAGNYAGISYAANRAGESGIFQFMTKDGTTETHNSTSAALAASKTYDFYVYVKPRDTTIYIRIDNLTDGVILSENSKTTNLPATTAAMRPMAILTNLSAATRTFGFQRMYVEADR